MACGPDSACLASWDDVNRPGFSTLLLGWDGEVDDLHISIQKTVTDGCLQLTMIICSFLDLSVPLHLVAMTGCTAGSIRMAHLSLLSLRHTLIRAVYP